jgi:Transcriptional Coactivator p15 (PC4)
MNEHVTLPEPIEIAKFWKNRRRAESVHVTLSQYEGRTLINVRVYATGADGIDRPTPKGIAMAVSKLPELAKALELAETKARALGLIDGQDGASEPSGAAK